MYYGLISSVHEEVDEKGYAVDGAVSKRQSRLRMQRISEEDDSYWSVSTEFNEIVIMDFSAS